MDYRIISIGALSRHELREDKGSPRTAHATTTLVRSGDCVILVDPGLPEQVMAARLSERAGIEPRDVTDVFLTNFRPAHRRGLAAFDHARWLVSERERETVGVMLVERFRETQDDELRNMLQQEIELLAKFAPAPDRLAPHIDLFPLPGFTPGTCGLLLPQSRTTTLIAGDAVATAEHLEQGRVLPGCYDIEQARESLVEAVEIADFLIPGHDNLAINPTRQPF